MAGRRELFVDVRSIQRVRTGSGKISPRSFELVGVDGLEPSTSRSPSARANRAAPHPVVSLSVYVSDVIDRARERALARLHSQFRACTGCADAGFIPRAFPIVAGKASDRVMIVGQAPGAVELTTGLPFSGRAGAELRRWLARAGIDEGHLPYRTAITKCFPGEASSGAGDRQPSPPEIANCAPASTPQIKRSSSRRTRSRGGSASIPRPSCAALARWTTQTPRASQRCGSVASGASHGKSSRNGSRDRARFRAWPAVSDASSEVAHQTLSWEGR